MLVGRYETAHTTFGQRVFPLEVERDTFVTSEGQLEKRVESLLIKLLYEGIEDPDERREIQDKVSQEIKDIGGSAVPILVQALQKPDLQTKQNAALLLMELKSIAPQAITKAKQTLQIEYSDTSDTLLRATISLILELEDLPGLN